MKSLSLGLFVVFIFSGIIVCFASAEDCSEVVRNKCMSCHSIKNICRKEQKDIVYWETIINRMNKFGADISKKERKIIVGCLADVDSFNKICKPQ